MFECAELQLMTSGTQHTLECPDSRIRVAPLQRGDRRLAATELCAELGLGEPGMATTFADQGARVHPAGG